MFTGIVTGTGRVARHVSLGAGGGVRITVDVGDWPIDDLAIGDSVAHSGCCLTIVDKGERWLASDVSAHTLSIVSGLEVGARVNLEKALTLADRLGGHLLTGHIDTVGTVVQWMPIAESWRLEVELPAAFGRYLARKGSVAVHGVSLTVNEVTDGERACRFQANVIPHTREVTNFCDLRVGAKVNIEVDLLARYVERILAVQSS
ncbi:MAG: riboflavin synthase [Casimicrobiaceae bacterium]|nr:riboflavin synthase [Casimicrobiaceae bacterium]MCX8099168.1 riboflavin synthase [Casimicrobiaceae bacterium]MDW8312607.1 riboflavin synthase [Burkholderiales bacterium]